MEWEIDSYLEIMKNQQEIKGTVNKDTFTTFLKVLAEYTDLQRSAFEEQVALEGSLASYNKLSDGEKEVAKGLFNLWVVTTLNTISQQLLALVVEDDELDSNTVNKVLEKIVAVKVQDIADKL